MAQLTASLRQAIPSLQIAAYGIDGYRMVEGPTYQRAICGAAMGMNISRYNDVYLYSSDRIAHLMGNGVATLIDRATGFADVFGEDEALFYGSRDEMLSQIARHALDKTERMRVGRLGHARYRDLFDSAKIGQYMLDVLMEDALPMIGIGRESLLLRTV